MRDARPGSDPRGAPELAEVAPFCAHIQSKKAYFLGRPPNSERELLDASQSCWCRRTMQALGPDGEIVDPADCRAGRVCYQSVL